MCVATICLVDSIPIPPTHYMQRLNFSIDSFSSTQRIYAMRTRFSVYTNKNYECTAFTGRLSTILMQFGVDIRSANELKKKAEKARTRRKTTGNKTQRIMTVKICGFLSVVGFLFVFARLVYGFPNARKTFNEQKCSTFFLDISWSAKFEQNFKRIDTQLQRKLIKKHSLNANGCSKNAGQCLG